MENKPHNISLIIQACRSGKRAAQKRLYQLYFSYGMSVALRYAGSKPEAEEILNEAFFKAFTKIDQFDDQYDFKNWFRRILVNTSIDYHRKFKKLQSYTMEELPDYDSSNNDGFENLLYEDLIVGVKKLPPVYRMVFNLVAIEGYKHSEVAEQLNISAGTSRSNYARARKLLQSFLNQQYKINRASNGE